ncbi:hypothetical protein MPUL_12910 [Mycolicibacterium pulveris]|uniref:3-oxoacyl-[acyl-carrier-protein] reductase MabA n=1 Tax=Mycolicibacterium pulveris TaxID=36813 RepID=A0A7I7UGW3_MYCPV|nr:hypothetical protein MPUL_12910 [Mycolicibacterium pulveris]
MTLTDKRPTPRLYAAEGAKVIVHGRNAERGAKTVRDIENAGGKARFIAADLADATDARRFADAAGDVDVLVNNAGIYRFAATADTTDADFDEQINTNLRAPYVLVQKLVSGMIARGGGTVVNVSTVAASTPAADAGIYGASKAGLDLLTKLWADEFGARGVRVNAVSPGPRNGFGPNGHTGGDRQRRDVLRLTGRQLRQRRDPDRRRRPTGDPPRRLIRFARRTPRAADRPRSRPWCTSREISVRRAAR